MIINLISVYRKIYDFCKAKNTGTCLKNGIEPTPRVNFITDLCEKEGIEYELDVWGKSAQKRQYSILDIPDLFYYLSDEEYEKASDLYYEFKEKAEEILQAIGIESDVEDLTSEEMDFLGDDFFILFEDYTKKISLLLGELEMPGNNFYNIMLMGNSDKFVVAHHDIINPSSDNANDNSCSVINALAIKKLRPEVNVVLLDGEEFGGIGSQRLSERIKRGEFKCKWILNLELTGKGGKNFFVGSMGTPLTDWIANRFECPIVKVPFNDSVIFKKNGINSTVINPLPITEKESPIIDKDGNYLEYDLLFKCHKMSDSLDSISTADMEEFVEEVCLKIIDEA